MTSWCVVGVPLGVRFTRILKETATQGRVFVVYDVDMDQPCWVSQSLPALLAAYNQRRSHSKRLHASSAYRVLRGQSTSALHKNHRFCALQRSAADDLNEHIAVFLGCFVVTKEGQAWYLDGLDLGAPQSPPLSAAAEESC